MRTAMPATTGLTTAPGWLVATLLLPATCLAAEPPPGNAPRAGAAFPLPEVTVTATRPVVDAPPTLVVRDVSVADLTAYNAHTVGDGLIPTPGVNVQYGGTSGDARAWIRGFRDRDTLVLFDGIPIASGFEGTIDLNEIATEQVGGIRVLKSAPSVIYGTNGMGGVIDILPRTGADAGYLSTVLEAGSDDRRLLRASSGAGDDNRNFLLSVSHEEADPYSLSDDYPGDLNQPPGERINSDFERDSLFLSLAARETVLGSTSLFYNLSDAEKGLAPTANVEEPDYERLTKSRRQTLGLSNQFAAIPLVAKLYYNTYESDLTTYTDGTYSVIDEVESAEDYSYGAKLYSTLQTHPNNALILHAAGQTDVYKAEGELEDGNKAELSTWTLAVEDQFWITETLSVAAGVIWNLFDQTRLDESSSALSPQLALGWQASEAVVLHASAARRTRFPKLRELYRRKYGNPDLEEQTANNYDVGATWQHRPGYASDISFFYSDVKDLIERPDRDSLYENLAPVTIRGVEMATGGSVTDALYARLAYTYVKAEEDLPGIGDRQLRSRPTHTAQAELRYLMPRDFSLAVEAIYVDKLYDLDEDEVYTELDNYLILQLKLARDFTEQLSGYVAVSNVTDEDYEQRLGEPRPGRSVRIGLSFAL